MDDEKSCLKFRQTAYKMPFLCDEFIEIMVTASILSNKPALNTKSALKAVSLKSLV